MYGMQLRSSSSRAQLSPGVKALTRKFEAASIKPATPVVAALAPATREPPEIKRKRHYESRFKSSDHVTSIISNAAGPSPDSVALVAAGLSLPPTFHRHQGETNMCYVTTLITALAYMVHLGKINFEELPHMAQIFICTMTNLYGWNVWNINYEKVLQNLQDFAKKYDTLINELVVVLTQQDDATVANQKLLNKLLKVATDDAKRAEHILNGGLVQISLDVLLSHPEPNCLTQFDYVLIYPKNSVTLTKKGVGRHCEHAWHACFVGLRNDKHYICCVNTGRGDEDEKWFDTLEKEKPRHGKSLKVDDLVFLVDRVTHKP